MTEEKTEITTDGSNPEPPKRKPGRPRKSPPTVAPVPTPKASESPAPPSEPGADVRQREAPKGHESDTAGPSKGKVAGADEPKPRPSPKIARSTKRSSPANAKPAVTGGGPEPKPADDGESIIPLLLGAAGAVAVLLFLRARKAGNSPSNGGAEPPSVIENAWAQIQQEWASFNPETLTIRLSER